MGQIERDQVRRINMETEQNQENIFTVNNWIRVNRYVRYLENIENELYYVLNSEEFREFASSDLTCALKSAMRNLEFDINQWTAVCTRIRAVLKEEVEKSRNNG